MSSTLTGESKLSLIELLKRDYNDDSTSHPELQCSYSEVVGEKADRFVSFSYGTNYMELVESLESYLKNNPHLDPKKTFFWVDMLVNDQWFALDRDFTWWSTTFKEAIGNIGHTLIFMVPWNSPIPLTRVWCLWELYCTRSTGSNLEILLSSTQTKDFYKSLVVQPDEASKSVASIDVKTATSYLPEDKEMIFAVIDRSEGGADAINDTISRYSSWIGWLIHTYIYLYPCIYVYICWCVCVEDYLRRYMLVMMPT